MGAILVFHPVFVNRLPVCLVVEQEPCELGQLEPVRPAGLAGSGRRGIRKVRKSGDMCLRRHLLQPSSPEEALTPGRTAWVYRGGTLGRRLGTLGRRLKPCRRGSCVLERGVCSRGSDARCGTLLVCFYRLRGLPPLPAPMPHWQLGFPRIQLKKPLSLKQRRSWLPQTCLNKPKDQFSKKK